MKIIIDARYKYNYSSFYILGLRKLFGRRSITYSVKPFLSLSYSTIKEYNSGLPFIIDDNSKTYKVFIDFEDKSFISIDRYNWCDIYAKINATYDDLIKYGDELKVKEAGRARLEGKDYLMQDGDICHFRFNV